MSVEAAPNLTPEPAPKSEKRSKKQKRSKAEAEEDASNVIQLSDYQEQMEEAEHAAREPESKGDRPSGIYASERRKMSEVEREHQEQETGKLISLREERDVWREELEGLEAKSNLSGEEEERCDELRSRIERVELMEDRAKSAEERDKTEERMEEVEDDLQAERERLTAVENERTREQEERTKLTEDIRNDEKRIDKLNAELKANPTDAGKAEIAKITQRLEEAKSEMEGRSLRIRDLRHEEASIHAKVTEKSRILELFAASLIVLNTTIAKLDSKIRKEPVPLEDERSAPEREQEPEEEEWHAPPSRLSRAARAMGRALGASAKTSVPIGGALVGGTVALGAAALAAGGRFFNTFFKNFQKIVTHPIKFFNEVTSKFSSDMQSPPSGKGPIVGFMNGLKWLAIGDAPPKKQKQAK